MYLNKEKTSLFKHLSILIYIGLFFISCNTNQYLLPDQSLLKKANIVFKNEKLIKNKVELQNELLTFITSKPNEKLLFVIPKEYIYSKYKGVLKNLGEKPTLYDEAAAKKIAQNMENYLRYKKGFYEAKVDFITEEKNKGFTSSSGTEVWTVTHISYLVNTGQPYKIKGIAYETNDKKVLDFINSHQEGAFVKAGDDVDFSKFELEKSRLTIALQNNGYINFSNNYFEITGDSNKVKKEIDIFIQVKPPLPDSLHQQFTTGDIQVFTDFYKDQPKDMLSVDSLDKVRYYRQLPSFLVKPSVLDNAIFFEQEKLVSRDDRQKTFRKLNKLGTYRFVNINSFKSPGLDTVLNFDIQLAPFPKKWIWDGGLQGYFSTLGAARLFGTSVSSQFINRNLFGGSERYTLRAEAGMEIGYEKQTGFVQRANNISLQNNLVIPSFQDFISLGKLAHKTGIIKDQFYKNFREEATTNIGLGFNVNNIINFYSLNSVNASFGFDYTSPKNNRYIFRPLGFNLDLYEIKDSTRFKPQVLLAFQDILSTGFLFRDLSYIYNRSKDNKGRSFFVLNNLELSGWEVHLTNKLFNALSSQDQVWSLDKIAFAKYLRYELDGRYNREYSKTTSFASRLNLGIVVPYGESKVVPFVRQFGVGGPNSLRAWNIRQPGPGGFYDSASDTSSQAIFVNQGDFKLELNAEYRFKIISVFDGAFFVDAGNVWTLREDANRPNANLTGAFLNQMAIGVGYGVRFNFDFFIIRFDFGYKIRNPHKDEVTGRYWNTIKEVRQQGLGNLQVAVNYPF
jgi:outer membrane protein insertion porin family